MPLDKNIEPIPGVVLSTEHFTEKKKNNNNSKRKTTSQRLVYSKVWQYTQKILTYFYIHVCGFLTTLKPVDLMLRFAEQFLSVLHEVIHCFLRLPAMISYKILKIIP